MFLSEEDVDEGIDSWLLHGSWLREAMMVQSEHDAQGPSMRITIMWLHPRGQLVPGNWFLPKGLEGLGLLRLESKRSNGNGEIIGIGKTLE